MNGYIFKNFEDNFFDVSNPNLSFNIILLKDTYTLNINDRIYEDLMNYELDKFNSNGIQTGYTKGGKDIKFFKTAYTDTVKKYSLSSVKWSSLLGEFRYAAIYRDKPEDSEKLLICIFDLGKSGDKNDRLTYELSWKGQSAISIYTSTCPITFYVDNDSLYMKYISTEKIEFKEKVIDILSEKELEEMISKILTED